MTKLVPLSLIFITFFTQIAIAQELQFFQTDWGRTDSWYVFCKRSKAAGYDGVEVWMPTETQSILDLNRALKQYDLKVIFLAGTDKSIPFETSFNSLY